MKDVWGRPKRTVTGVQPEWLKRAGGIRRLFRAAERQKAALDEVHPRRFPVSTNAKALYDSDYMIHEDRHITTRAPSSVPATGP